LDGIYLIDNGYMIILYIRQNVNSQILSNLFGVSDIKGITKMLSEEEVFGNLENDFKMNIYQVIENIRRSKSIYQSLLIVVESIHNDKM
jgi:hypothetical protein